MARAAMLKEITHSLRRRILGRNQTFEGADFAVGDSAICNKQISHLGYCGDGRGGAKHSRARDFAFASI